VQDRQRGQFVSLDTAALFLPYSEMPIYPIDKAFMKTCPTLSLVVVALAPACDADRSKERSPAETGPAYDTGPVTDPGCDTGHLDDDGECVPASCGTGTWGNLEADESTIYVDIAAAEGGAGSETAPFSSIQLGLDAAGDAGGGMVAVAAGTYQETLQLGLSHDGVTLAGRCSDLVVIDASAGDEWTPGIRIDAMQSEVVVAGVTVDGARYPGVLVGAGRATVRDSKVVGSEYCGFAAFQSEEHETSLVVESCEVSENTATGVLAYGSGTSVVLRDTIIQDSSPDSVGENGYGINVYGGANLMAESCEVSGSTAVGVLVNESGTTVTLLGTTIQGTKPNQHGEGGYGIDIYSGASLEADTCALSGNTVVGILAAGSGTTVALRGTTIDGNLADENEEFGYGIDAWGGASLEADACVVSDNAGIGILVDGTGTTVTLLETTIQGTQPAKDGMFGYGLAVQNGASLEAASCEVSENTAVGVFAGDSGTRVFLQDTTITSTQPGELQTVSLGIVVQDSATVEAAGVEAVSNKGPGLYAVNRDTSLTCSGCVLQGNQFAGAVVVNDASLVIHSSTIEGTTEAENIGGGVGIYADPWGGVPPTVTVTDTAILDNPIAGVWLSGGGSYSLSGNSIHGGEGWYREGLAKCGDAVYARNGATTWDGSSGLLLEDNGLLDGLGAGLFLDNATATLASNVYADNTVDIIAQGSSCEEPPEGYGGEQLSSDAELCPTYDYATCGDEFRLYLELAEPALGYGGALAGPPLPGPGAPPLPAPTIVRSQPPGPAARPRWCSPRPRRPPRPGSHPPRVGCRTRPPRSRRAGCPRCTSPGG